MHRRKYRQWQILEWIKGGATKSTNSYAGGLALGGWYLVVGNLIDLDLGTGTGACQTWPCYGGDGGKPPDR